LLHCEGHKRQNRHGQDRGCSLVWLPISACQGSSTPLA
jgi:hypothetical protein